MKWLDSRIHKPDCNSFRKYYVIANVNGLLMQGLSGWWPKDDYTDGYWYEFEFTNGNKQGRHEVLYWMQWPTQMPDVLSKDVVNKR